MLSPVCVRCGSEGSATSAIPKSTSLRGFRLRCGRGPVHHHVVGLHVAVDDPDGVRRGEAVTDLREQGARPLRQERALLLDERAERSALDPLEHEVVAVSVDAEVVHGDAARVVDPARDARLALEALGEPGDLRGAPSITLTATLRRSRSSDAA